MSDEKKESTPTTHVALAAHVDAWAKSLPSIKEARAAVEVAGRERIEAERAVENAAALDFLVRGAHVVAPTGGSEAAAQRRQWAMAPQSDAFWTRGVYTVTGKGDEVRKAYSQLLQYVQEKTC